MKNRLILLLLALLGLSTACDESAVEYGSPSADFQVKGKVTDAQGNPIRGVSVRFDARFEADRQTTAEDGTYTCLIRNVYLFGEPYPLLFRDTDGPENGGEFADRDEEVVFTNEDRIAPGSGWNTGLYQKTVDVTLTPKEDK